MANQDNIIRITSSPHVSYGQNTQDLMRNVIIALLPLCVYGVYLYGLRALCVILLSVIASVGFEALFQKLTKQKISIKDCSAIVTGLIFALVLPPTTPIWMILLGSLFAVVVAKGFFGGLGANVFNPALAGRAFLFVSFPAALGATWLTPHVDTITSATILSQMKDGFTGDASTYLQYFLGNRAGCIGESSVLLILLAFVYLLVTKVIDWRAPIAMTVTMALATAITAIIKGNDVVGSVILSLISGGFALGAVFMVTDYATAPVTKKGRIVFGAGCGLLTFLIRNFGGYPEGVMFSILIMNTISAFLNGLTDRKYGYTKKSANGANK